MGASTDPCGTPDFKRTVLLNVCPILTCWVLLVSQDLRKRIKMAPISQTLSNAFFASKKIMMVGSGCVALTDLV